MATLVGTEILYVLPIAANGSPAATTEQCTTLDIAALADAANNPAVINTAISTAGAGTLTAAGLVGGVITRTGPSAAFSDATDTAVAIVAALAAYVTGESQFVEIRNTTAFAQTITAGAGLTLTGSAVIPANSVGVYLMTISSPTAVTLLNISVGALSTSAPMITTALTTVGAGTITAAGIAGGVTLRGGSQSGSAFTDTTDTGTATAAAYPNIRIGQSFQYIYKNNTDAVATVTGGVGVTVSGYTKVPANGTARYLITYTASNTFTMVGIMAGGMAADAADPTKLIGFTASGMTTAKTAVIAATNALDATYTLPPSTGVLAATTGTNLYIADIKKCTSAVTKNANVTYANVTGLSQTVVAGTYRFSCVLPSTVASGTGGIKYAFNYTTTVLTSIESTAHGYTSAAVAVQHTTTTTTQTDLFTQAAVVILVRIEGTMVVSTGGTIDLQMAQNTSNASDTVALLGGSMEFVRIA